MAKDSELWDIICDGPHVPVNKDEADMETTLKTRQEYNEVDRKAVKKNSCTTAKEIWEALQTAHEGTSQVKNSKIDMLTTEYELFKIKEDRSIHDMHTRFTSLINKLSSLGEVITSIKMVRKLLGVLPDSWDIKVNAIYEAKDLAKLTVDEIIGNLKTYEIKMTLKKEEKNEAKRERNLVL
ncbi:uncharacterized protein LOC132612995 [Lycium barbarum]|uniref:uncharacterized protein LOC132612995 n=1 Tax=Lycium barbarum TaxID=112863 RepID=UPI00293E9FD6|nr:uncharacterized protein LOC132612995 [Lycium barbarum]